MSTSTTTTTVTVINVKNEVHKRRVTIYRWHSYTSKTAKICHFVILVMYCSITNLHVNADVFQHPPRRLASRRPIWSDTTPVDTTAQWRDDWQSASVVNYTIVTDPTIWQPGLNLTRQSWSLLNCFWTGQGQCCAILHKWGLAKSLTCDCGQQQTMSDIANACPLTKFNGELQLLHEDEDDAVKWLESTATAAFTKWIIIIIT